MQKSTLFLTSTDVGFARYFYGDGTATNARVEVDLPKANSTPVSDSDAEPLIVSIDAAQSFISIWARATISIKYRTVRQRVAGVKRNPDKAVMVWGDVAVPYGEVVSLMSELQAAGAPSVGLVTEALRESSELGSRLIIAVLCCCPGARCFSRGNRRGMEHGRGHGHRKATGSASFGVA